MKIVLISRAHGEQRTLDLGRWSRALLSLCCLGLPLGMIGLGYFLAAPSQSALGTANLDAMQDELEAQDAAVASLREQARRRLQALSLSVAALEARLLRLDALGERLTQLADLDDGEFDFSRAPALGGPLSPAPATPVRDRDLTGEIDALASQIADREDQLAILEALLENRQLSDDLFLSGRPVKKGWMSSPYGRRTDPLTGQAAFHDGVDFAGSEGADVVAVASGVVTSVGQSTGYGEVVEISHGDGYVTRYGHNRDNLVEVGDVVRKGQVIARMGSTGRSTGPHVHYEVYKHGRPVDPASYIRRTRR
jgi:murein DD-endopeptidase MepM/ murein hydrolase activator NlpD